MEPQFWHERWANRHIGFHEGEPNSLLTAHFSKMELPAGARVFLPLCGKTRDIAWLLERGYRVVGSELSEQAVRECFEELGVAPTVDGADRVSRYRADDVEVLVGDLFNVPAGALGPVDAVYDRAALVALPQDMRARYTAHLTAITDAAPQLLITFAYDQSLMDGPPFSVVEDEVRRHYEGTYVIEQVETREVPGGLKGQAAASEAVWLLKPGRS